MRKSYQGFRFFVVCNSSRTVTLSVDILQKPISHDALVNVRLFNLISRVSSYNISVIFNSNAVIISSMQRFFFFLIHFRSDRNGDSKTVADDTRKLMQTVKFIIYTIDISLSVIRRFQTIAPAEGQGRRVSFPGPRDFGSAALKIKKVLQRTCATRRVILTNVPGSEKGTLWLPCLIPERETFSVTVNNWKKSVDMIFVIIIRLVYCFGLFQTSNLYCFVFQTSRLTVAF